ncbi:DUF1707 SHOCT-like domain-containing protein [Actinocatenispora thailandica]|uniref:DUF1707 SHOCT-like domain-containing protein n=1 Tax=Actinocatenispora thailandica TaxID=227318 RepID=UPI00195264DC|nr:DUF1707 domain-containing protein [Actinocatenispora thailandica]
MTNEDGTSGEGPRPTAVRIGDAERESAVQALGEHMKAGRLQVDEYSERSGRAAEARTADELTSLFTDLPAPHPTLPDAGAGAAVRPVPAGGDLDQHRPPGTPAQRAAGALIGVSWIGAVVLMVTTGFGWWMFAIPIALSVVFGSIWGKGWQRELNGRDDRRDWPHDRRDARQQRRDDRRNRRGHGYYR